MPHCFATGYSDVCKHARVYSMAELSNMIWLGVVFAEVGPKAFQTLWAHLHTVLVHYICGPNETTRATRESGNQALVLSAELLEQFVYDGQVSRSLLKPNLHVALCNLRDQEELWGPVALFAEWYMEQCKLPYDVCCVVLTVL